MNLIKIGHVSNTHGLKGEIRILSDFKFKENAFKIGNKLYIMNDELIIKSYRQHKEYDMVIFKELDKIDDVLIYKGEDVYIDRNTLEYDGYLDEDLIGLDVYNNNQLMGKVVDIMKTNAHDILVIQNGKRHLVPNIEKFVKNVDLENKRIEIEYIKGLAGED